MDKDLRTRHRSLVRSNKIKFREWICSGIVLAFFMCSLINECRYCQSKPPKKVSKFSHKQQEIKIDVKGAVKNPGCYSFAIGETLKDVLGQAKVLQNAAKQNLYMKKRMVHDQSLVIPEKKRDNKSGKK